MIEFCERIKELRIKNNLSIAQLSKETGISPSTIFRWETKTVRVKIHYLCILADFFECINRLSLRTWD